MLKTVCDLCGEPIGDKEYSKNYKIKEWCFGGWDRIDAHPECVRKLMKRRTKSNYSLVDYYDVMASIRNCAKGNDCDRCPWVDKCDINLEDEPSDCIKLPKDLVNKTIKLLEEAIYK